MKGVKKIPIPEDVGDFLAYDPESESGLVWKVKRGYAGCNKGDSAGSVNGTGTYNLTLRKRKYLNHRVIWYLFHGELDPDKEIDHLDGNRKNNNINNLRLVYRTLNARNHKMLCLNTSGVTGVKLTDAGKGHTYWSAFWRDINGKDTTKHFSIAKLGDSLAKQLAIECRQFGVSKIENGYTERHGTRKVVPA